MIAGAVVVIIAVAQVAAGVLLYRMRVVAHWSAGDLVVFGVPVIIALLAQLGAVTSVSANRPGRQPGTGSSSIVVAGAVTAVAFLVTLLISLNVYGS
jgi:hypothetical protein